LVSWNNSSDRAVAGPYLLREMEKKILKIKKNLKVAKTGRKTMLIREEHTGNLKLGTMYF
jgi:hypothetical protein